MTYGDVSVLFYDGEYEKAGEYFVKEIFPKRYKKH